MKVSDIFPSRTWIATYNWHKLQQDIYVGLTCGVMVVPQGLAYAALAGLPPVYGLYSSMLPCVVYAFLGTSKDTVVGPFALVSLLVVDGVKDAMKHSDSADDVDMTIRTTMGMSLVVGLIFLVLAALRFGNITCFLSKTVLSGFTTSAALLIATSQAKDFFGLNGIKRGNFVDTWEQIIPRLKDSNRTTVLISFSTMAVLLVGKWFNDRFKDRLPVPLMMELIVVVIGSVLVFLLQLDEIYDVGTVGSFPKGLPGPLMPHLSTSLLTPSAVVALTTFIVSSSVAKAFGQRNGYTVTPNQELIALGMANVLGSFFRDYPSCASLSRSAVVDAMGAATPFHNVIAASVVALVLLTLTRPLKYLPLCVLSAIILCSLKSLLLQIYEPFHLWSRSKVEACIWVVTFFSTLFLGTELGIGIGVGFSLAPIIFKVTNADFVELGRLPDTVVYRNVAVWPNAEHIPGLLVLRFDAPLNFTNQERFESLFVKMVNGHRGALKAVVLECTGVADMDILALDMVQGITKKVAVPVIWVSPVAESSIKLEGSGLIYYPEFNLHEAVLHADRTFKAPPNIVVPKLDNDSEVRQNSPSNRNAVDGIHLSSRNSLTQPLLNHLSSR